MPWTFPLNAIDINARITFGVAWNDVDLSADVPAGTKAIVVFIRNLGAANYRCNVRLNGSSDALIRSLSPARFTHLIAPLDANRVFEGYLANAALDVRVVAYTSDDQFISPLIDKSLAVADSYVDVDVSGDGVPAGANAVWLMMATSGTRGKYALRPNGASYDYYYFSGGTGIGAQSLGFVGLDANRIFEHEVSVVYPNTGYCQCFLRGYANSEIQVVNPPVQVTASGASNWVDCTPAVPASALGVILQIVNIHATSDLEIRLRKKGGSDDFTGTTLRPEDQYFAVVGLSGGQFQVWSADTTYVKIFVVGYMVGAIPAMMNHYRQMRAA